MVRGSQPARGQEAEDPPLLVSGLHFALLVKMTVTQ